MQHLLIAATFKNKKDRNKMFILWR